MRVQQDRAWPSVRPSVRLTTGALGERSAKSVDTRVSQSDQSITSGASAAANMAKLSPKRGEDDQQGGPDSGISGLGVYRKVSGSNVSSLARSQHGASLARTKGRRNSESGGTLSASEEEDLRDRYYAYWERQKQVGRRDIFQGSGIYWVKSSRLGHHYLLSTIKWEVWMSQPGSGAASASAHQPV